MAASPLKNEESKHILVLGAGITGLSTALELLQTLKYDVTILATHFPGDFSPDYTSPWAGGHWRSHAGLSASEAEIRKWDARTYQVWKEMLEYEDGGSTQNREKNLALGFRECRYFWGKEGMETTSGDGSAIWFRDIVDGFAVLHLETEKDVPEGAIMGMRYKSICFDPSRYLTILFKKVQMLGAAVIKAKLDTGRGLEGVISDAKRILKEHWDRGEIFALINCAGLSARHFLSPIEAEKLFPVRGQTILIKGEAETTQTFVSIPGYPDSEMLYVVPRPGSGTTILGGCKQPGNWDEGIDEELNEKIIDGIKKMGLCEGLRDEKGEFEVLGSQVSFRPGRKGGPRVEVEQGEDGVVRMIDGCWVVHSYGHAGGGYQASIGCAEAVVAMVDELQSLGSQV